MGRTNTPSQKRGGSFKKTYRAKNHGSNNDEAGPSDFARPDDSTARVGASAAPNSDTATEPDSIKESKRSGIRTEKSSSAELGKWGDEPTEYSGESDRDTTNKRNRLSEDSDSDFENERGEFRVLRDTAGRRRDKGKNPRRNDRQNNPLARCNNKDRQRAGQGRRSAQGSNRALKEEVRRCISDSRGTVDAIREKSKLDLENLQADCDKKIEKLEKKLCVAQEVETKAARRSIKLLDFTYSDPVTGVAPFVVTSLSIFIFILVGILIIKQWGFIPYELAWFLASLDVFILSSSWLYFRYLRAYPQSFVCVVFHTIFTIITYLFLDLTLWQGFGLACFLDMFISSLGFDMFNLRLRHRFRYLRRRKDIEHEMDRRALEISTNDASLSAKYIDVAYEKYVFFYFPVVTMELTISAELFVQLTTISNMEMGQKDKIVFQRLQKKAQSMYGVNYDRFLTCHGQHLGVNTIDVAFNYFRFLSRETAEVPRPDFGL